MSRAAFESDGRPRWAAFRKVVDGPARGLGLRARRSEPRQKAPLGQRGASPALDQEDVPRAYRRVCQDLALARHRQYPARLVSQINELALAGHHALYSARRQALSSLVPFLLAGFPREVRANRGLFWFCALLFFGPFVAMILAGLVAPEWIYATLDENTIQDLNDTWGGDPVTRSAGENALMFGMYVFNNIGIDFMVFAGGLLAGLGTIYLSVFNGIYLGAAFGYIHHAGHEESFYTFVAGHGSFELTAIVISAMGGMKLGLAILKPGRYSRGHALRERGKEGARLLFGAAFMTFIAAWIEAFWSANAVAPSVKFGVGSALWAVVALWLLLGGRGILAGLRRRRVG